MANPDDDELPPRPRPRPREDEEASPGTASIQLWPTPVQPGLWTVVQWRGGTGNWYDVDGWRGGLNRDTYVSWRVLEPQFGKGPFRWFVYDRAGGEVLVGQ